MDDFGSGFITAAVSGFILFLIAGIAVMDVSREGFIQDCGNGEIIHIGDKYYQCKEIEYKVK